MSKCTWKDSKGVECGKPMTEEEYLQDGMCAVCADKLWNYLQTGEEWEHETRSQT